MNRVLLTNATFISTISAISTILLTNAGFADTESLILKVNLHNRTNYTCKTSSPNLRHGFWNMRPPKSIQAHTTDYWMVQQSHFYGPDVAVTLKCGDYSFSVRNRQTFSFVGGNQYCSTYGVDKHLKVTNKQIQHAKYRHIPGIADISVSLNGSHLELE
ncbi:hypothetical protein [Candidatus Sororendozoicomonas aggregata]|uniref:hypothetical protein n=1 Tax=Candidatus Sororendozoicomonas aggregata TaxID=3073239 RepID=UPI002ED37B3D